MDGLGRIHCKGRCRCEFGRTPSGDDSANIGIQSMRGQRIRTSAAVSNFYRGYINIVDLDAGQVAGSGAGIDQSVSGHTYVLFDGIQRKQAVLLHVRTSTRGAALRLESGYSGKYGQRRNQAERQANQQLNERKTTFIQE